MNRNRENNKLEQKQKIQRKDLNIVCLRFKESTTTFKTIKNFSVGDCQLLACTLFLLIFKSCNIELVTGQGFRMSTLNK